MKAPGEEDGFAVGAFSQVYRLFWVGALSY